MKKSILFFVFFIFLIFLSVSGTFEFIKIIKTFYNTINTKIEFLFILGFLFYLIIHIVFYKPIFIHVMSHELTHALWAFFLGGKTKKLEVSTRGGRVFINKTNFLISLAPYFFPLYTFILVIIYLIADKKFLPYISFFIGLSLSFHLALTLYSLKENQSDLKDDSNIFFSLIFIYFMNLVIIIFILSLISPQIKFLPVLKNIIFNGINIIKITIKYINEFLK